MKAIAIKNSFQVIVADTLPDGVGFIEIECRDYDHLRTLPQALTFNGLTYGRTGWNSDTHRAYYKTNKAFALGVTP